jgi:hypothetical protein
MSASPRKRQAVIKIRSVAKGATNGREHLQQILHNGICHEDSFKRDEANLMERQIPFKY